MENQLTVLSESLEKKLAILKQIDAYNKKQEELFSADQVDMDSFDASVEEKGRLIDALTKLDEGFELLYERLAEQLQENRARYAKQIRAIQEQIQAVMELSVTIQAQEARNKRLIEQYFARQRKGLQMNRKTSTAAYHYYQNASNTNHLPPQFLDSKQ